MARRGRGRSRRRPRLKVAGQAAHQARHRILRQRPAPKQRREGASNAPRICAAQVQPENRLVDASRASLVARNNLAAPLPLFASVTFDASSRHRKRRRAKRILGLARPRLIAERATLVGTGDRTQRQGSRSRHQRSCRPRGVDAQGSAVDRAYHPIPDGRRRAGLRDAHLTHAVLTPIVKARAGRGISNRPQAHVVVAANGPAAYEASRSVGAASIGS